MAETSGASMTRQELVAFAQKLEEWGKGLTDKEQAFLEELLGRAMSGGSGEVQGFMTTVPTTTTVTRKIVPGDVLVNPVPDAQIDMGNLVAGRFSGFLLGEM